MHTSLTTDLEGALPLLASGQRALIALHLPALSNRPAGQRDLATVAFAGQRALSASTLPEPMRHAGWTSPCRRMIRRGVVGVSGMRTCGESAAQSCLDFPVVQGDGVHVKVA